jgi:hypothetical protein
LLICWPPLHHPKLSCSVLVAGTQASDINNNDAALESPSWHSNKQMPHQNNSENAILPCGHALCEACEALGSSTLDIYLPPPVLERQDSQVLCAVGEAVLGMGKYALKEFWTVKRNQPMSTNRTHCWQRT